MKGKIAQHQKKRRTRQVYILLQDLLNRFPYLEGWGVGAKSLAAKAVQTDRQTQTDTGRHQTYRPLGLLETYLMSILWE